MKPITAKDNVDWSELQCVLREQLKPYGLCNRSLLKQYEPHKHRLMEIVKRTSLMGESNSALIIGPRGSGKSTLLEHVISNIFEDSSIKDNLIHVELNGLVHTDDNIALKDIMRQLQMENISDKVLGSFAEKLSFLLEALKSGSKQSKSILFVLDEFDLFCNHKDQTLLYNLFDVAQSQQSPICVVGISCRPDVLHKLENRVKSRFSHQLIYLLESITFSEYVEIAKEVLFLPQNFVNQKFRGVWNTNVTDVIQQATVKDVLKKHFEHSSNIRDLKRLLLIPVTCISSSHPSLEPGDFIDAFRYYSRDAKASVLQGLSILEISLVIAMMHLTEIYDGESFNFETVYHEYKKFLQKKMSLQNLDKAVVMKALEHLLAIELVKDSGESTKNTQKRYMSVRLLLEPTQIKEALKRYPNLPAQLQQWAASELME